MALAGGSTAVYGPGQAHRYLLARTWEPGAPVVAWVMLNPSTGGAVTTDPTLTRCQGFSRRWGFGGMRVVNLFALRSPDPAALSHHPSPVGDGNDEVIIAAVATAAMTVAAWGTHGRLAGRAREVTQALAATGVCLHCLDRTADGSPRHPLYVPAATPPQLYAPAAGRVGEQVTGPARRLTIGHRAGEDAVLIGPSGPKAPISGASPGPRNADGPTKGADQTTSHHARPDPLPCLPSVKARS